MKILRATHLGMCFGVRDAIALAMEQSRKGPLTILGELVHNPTVNRTLAENGVTIERELEKATTYTVMITAHGASDQTLEKVRSRGHHLIEATCPLVHFAHRSLKELVAQGYHPVIIGKRDHVEIRGMTGDLDSYDIVSNEEDVLKLTEHARLGIVSQTTQPIDKVHALIDLIRERFPHSEIYFKDTVCQPTKQRQSAAIELARLSDVVIVIGGKHSNNTRELASTCRRYCNCVVQVQNVSELHSYWFYGARIVGLTAGTSTPDSLIDEVEQWLNLHSEVEKKTSSSQATT
jgi:4-hydroxy-3-methylbut-2-en-1-yl diphosphate reductase